MKNKFKILTLAACLALPLPVKADTGGVAMLAAGTITNNTTRTTGFSDVKIDNNTVVGLQVNMQGSQAGTGNIICTLARSKDGSSFETTPRFTITNALNGNTAVVGYADISAYVQSAHTIRLISVQNADANASATNCTIAVVKKIPKTN